MIKMSKMIFTLLPVYILCRFCKCTTFYKSVNDINEKVKLEIKKLYNS